MVSVWCARHSYRVRCDACVACDSFRCIEPLLLVPFPRLCTSVSPVEVHVVSPWDSAVETVSRVSGRPFGYSELLFCLYNSGRRLGRLRHPSSPHLLLDPTFFDGSSSEEASYCHDSGP